MKHIPPGDSSNKNRNKRAAKRNAVKLWIGFICICVVISVLGTLKLSKGKTAEEDNQENAIAANECLNQAFGQTANGTIIFPEDYAGAYIDGGHLVLLLTNTSEEATEKYRNWAGEYSSCLTFKKVKYPYNELSEKLDPIVEKLKEDGYEVTSSAVSETENAVSIGLFKCESAEASKLAKSLSEAFDVRVLVSEIIYTTSNSINNMYSITGTLSSPAVGTIIKYYSRTTSSFGYGSVERRNVTVLADDRDNISGLTEVKVTSGSCESGDSGGPFFQDASSGAKYCGVLHGKRTDSSGNLYVFFTPYTYISSAGFSVRTN